MWLFWAGIDRFGAIVDRFWSFFVMMLCSIGVVCVQRADVLSDTAVLVAIWGVYWIGEVGLHIILAVLM
jgi:hypothetical protein